MKNMTKKNIRNKAKIKFDKAILIPSLVFEYQCLEHYHWITMFGKLVFK